MNSLLLEISARRYRAGCLWMIFAAVYLAMAGCVPSMAQGRLWEHDPNVQQVLELRRRGIAAITSGRVSAETESYSSTFVANTPDNGVVRGETLLEMFAAGAVAYASIVQQIDYAASHGPDMVVIMGIETVVPGDGMRNAGKTVRRRFTDVFRRENGAWRHDLRHADVISVE